MRLIIIFTATLVKINVGWRPTTQDTFPLIGKTSLNNLFIATGTKRISYCIISENLNDDATKKPNIDLNTFTRKRF